MLKKLLWGLSVQILHVLARNEAKLEVGREVGGGLVGLFAFEVLQF